MGDTLDEIDETFLVNLSNPLNGSLQDSQGTGTITDEDLPPNMSIEDVTVTDGVTSNVLATFVIRLDAPSGKQITVNFATQDDSAIAPQDYLAATGQATINPGQTQFSITVTVIGTLGNEPAESFFVNLSGAVNANLVDNQAIGTTCRITWSFFQLCSIPIADTGIIHRKPDMIPVWIDPQSLHRWVLKRAT